MESSTVDNGRVAPSPPRRWIVDWRLIGIVIVTEITAVFLAYMVINRPLVGAKLTREEAQVHWPAAAIGALVVALGVFLIVRETVRARRTSASPVIDIAEDEAARAERVPRSLRFERVPGTAVAIASGVSLATIPLSIVFSASLPLAWLAFLAPWIPLVVLEAQHHALDQPRPAGDHLPSAEPLALRGLCGREPAPGRALLPLLALSRR